MYALGVGTAITVADRRFGHDVPGGDLGGSALLVAERWVDG